MSSDPREPYSPSDPSRPTYPPYPPYPPPRGFPVLGCMFAFSFLANIALFVVVIFGCFGLALKGDGEDGGSMGGLPMQEKYHSGSKTATDSKIAIVSLDGILMDGLLDFAHKEIDKAGKDKNVKAVVLHINSPGGSITASDDLHRRLIELRDGNQEKKTTGKPMVVSMGSVAASGGYYVAMPAKTLFAERSTMTGSIGVYASFLNIKELSEKYGFTMETIKQGEIKDSGSMFKTMSPKEKEVWQGLVDHAYQQFLEVVEAGRPALKGKMLTPITITPVKAGPGPNKMEPYQRYRADGGVFTADKALEFGLIDKIGTLDDAVAEAKKLAGLTEYKAIKYEKQKLLAELLLGAKAPKAPTGMLDPGRLKGGLLPRVWYLTPGAEMSGLLAAAEAN